MFERRRNRSGIPLQRPGREAARTAWSPDCLLLLLAVGCGAGVPGHERPVPFSGTAILASDIRIVEARTAFEAVIRLRPWFLGNRRGNQEAIVVLNGVPIGGTANLETIPVGQILRIEYLGAAEATTRFGPQGHGGAILVQVGKGPAP